MSLLSYISTFNPTLKNKSYCTYTLILIAFFLIGVASFNSYVDPYWLFKPEPIWQSSSALNTKQRFCKSLQLRMREPNILFIGSSRVYRGINPDSSLFPREITYNSGISSLTISEAFSLIQWVSPLKTVKVIVLGLDFWMFDENEKPLEILERPGAFFNDLATALLSLSAIQDSRAAIQGQKSESYWVFNGFHHTPSRSAKEVEGMYRSYKEHMGQTKIDLYKLNVLKKIIEFCKEKEIKLLLYISPLHKKTYQLYNATLFKKWAQGVRDMAQKYGVPFKDYSKTYLYKTYPLFDGSTEEWLDYSHFSPKIGQMIQEDMALKTCIQ